MYAELSQDKRLRANARRAVYAELATTYLEARDPFRAWQAYRYIRERWGSKGLEPDFDVYITWLSQGGSCAKARDVIRCEALPKPNQGRALDLVYAVPLKEQEYRWRKASLPIAL